MLSELFQRFMEKSPVPVMVQMLLERALSAKKLDTLLLQLAENVNLSQFKKSRRGPKKKPPKRDKYSKHNHVSTAKLLEGKKPRE